LNADDVADAAAMLAGLRSLEEARTRLPDLMTRLKDAARAARRLRRRPRDWLDAIDLG
jgi:hypothetical protein